MELRRKVLGFFAAQVAAIAMIMSCASEDVPAPGEGAPPTGDGAPPATQATNDARVDTGLDAAQPDAARPDAAQHDATTVEDAGVDAAQSDAAQSDAAQPDAEPCSGPSAANLLANPGFDTDLGSWSTELLALQASWDPEDALGCPTSGAIGVTTSNASGINAAISQCVPVEPGVAYNLGGRVFVPSAAAADMAIIMVDWSSDASCAAPISSDLVFADTATTGVWQSLSASKTSPDTAASANVRLKIVTQGNSFRPLFDRVFFSRAPSTF